MHRFLQFFYTAFIRAFGGMVVCQSSWNNKISSI